MLGKTKMDWSSLINQRGLESPDESTPTEKLLFFQEKSIESRLLSIESLSNLDIPFSQKEHHLNVG